MWPIEVNTSTLKFQKDMETSVIDNIIGLWDSFVDHEDTQMTDVRQENETISQQCVPMST